MEKNQHKSKVDSRGASAPQIPPEIPENLGWDQQGWVGIPKFPAGKRQETVRNPNPHSGEFLPSGNAERFWEIKLRSGREGAQVPPKNPKNVELSLVQLCQSQSYPKSSVNSWNSVCASPAWEFQEGGEGRERRESSS